MLIGRQGIQADGHLDLPEAIGRCVVLVSAVGAAPGYLEFTRPVTESLALTLTLKPARALGVRAIMRGTREPVPMASVELQRVLTALPRELERDFRQAGSGDAFGRLEFRGLAEGTYELLVQAPSFQPVARVVTVKGEDRSELEIELVHHGFLEGIVVDARGARVEGATVRVSRGAGARDVTDAHGAFSLELPSGVYGLSATLGTRVGVVSEAQRVRAGETTRCPDIQLGPPGRVEGRVIDTAGGTPLSGVHVGLTPGAHRAETDAEGRFSVEELLPGRYRLSASMEGFTDEVIEVVVDAGERALPVLALRAEGELEGRLLSTHGVGVADVLVEVSWRGADEPRVLRPDPAGRFSTGPVPAGTLKVSTRSATGVILSSEVLSVEPGQVTRRDFVLRPLGRISGVVRAADGGRPGSALVELASPQAGNAVLAQALVDERGSFSLDVSEGRYLLRAYTPGRYGAFGPSSEIGVRAGSDAPVTLLLPLQEGALAGVVVGPEGAPSPGAAILVRGTAFEARRVADPFGRFSLHVPADGELEVRVLRGGQWAVVRSRPDTHLTIRLSEGARVLGTVKGARVTDEPLHVSARSESFDVLGSDGLLGMQFRGERFELVDVPAGPLRILVSDRSGVRGTANVVVPPGQTALVTIELSRPTSREP
ncbi:MSCRAMM family protein [Myxococcus fulvus]|uniref:MSCRAMM family protein n=1 Tax=Myxococcus fulvus TaxID=33 RepID=UPI003B9BA00E